MNTNLQKWISISENIQTTANYDMQCDDEIGPFANGYSDDLYISSMSEVFDLLENELNKDAKDTLFYIAKGLDIFSQKKTNNYFTGIDEKINTLFICGLYYLAGRFPSAVLKVSTIEPSQGKSILEVFLIAFFKQDFPSFGFNRQFRLFPLFFYFWRFLNTGDNRFLDYIIWELDNDDNINTDDNSFILSKLAIAVIKNFKSNNIWHDLLLQKNDNQYWRPFIKTNLIDHHIWDFFDSQRTALAKGILRSFKAISLQMPTSAGKTAICELIIYNFLKQNRDKKVLLLIPFRALAAELSLTFCKKLSSYGIHSRCIYGGNTSLPCEEEAVNIINLLVSTPEKFSALENSIPNLAEKFQLIICDEGHLIDDENRGTSYELLLSRLRNRQLQFVFLSAIIPNIIDINRWLNGDDESVIVSQYRPTELEYAFLVNQSDMQYSLSFGSPYSATATYQLNDFITPKDYSFTNPETGRSNKYRQTFLYLSILTAKKSLSLGNVAIYSPTKSDVERISKNFHYYISMSLSFIKTNMFCGELAEYVRNILGKDYLLFQCLQYNFAFHHGDLPQNIRELIEIGLRKRQIDWVVCTNTLAEGINLPIRTLIVHSTYRKDRNGKRQQIKVRDLQNIIGRAGRAGKDIKGTVIAINKNDFEIVMKATNASKAENVYGFLYRATNAFSEYLKSTHHGQIEALTNDLFDGDINENLKRFVAHIDLNLISMQFSHRENGMMHANELISNTFSYHLLRDEFEKKILERLFSLRNMALKPFWDELNILKRSGCSIREYTDIKNKIDFNKSFWQLSCEFFSSELCNELLVEIENLESYAKELSCFNSMNGVNLSTQDIQKAICLWTQNSWYNDIARELGIDVKCSLRLVNQFIGYTLQNILNQIINIGKELFATQRMPDILIYAPRLIEIGIDSLTALNLYEMGLRDRMCIKHIVIYYSLPQNLSRDEIRKCLLKNEFKYPNSHSEAYPIPVICQIKLLQFWRNTLHDKNIDLPGSFLFHLCGQFAYKI